MATDPKRPFVNSEDYLRTERQADHKSEYIDGQVFAMAGTTKPHAEIVGNLLEFLRPRLRSAGCGAYANDLRLHIPAPGVYTYPDVMITCGEVQMLDDHNDTVLNPIVIIEVLSSSTQDYDRGAKFEYYRSIPSLAEYITIAQDRVLVEQRLRKAGFWTHQDHRDLAEVLTLSVGAALTLGEIYQSIF